MNASWCRFQGIQALVTCLAAFQLGAQSTLPLRGDLIQPGTDTFTVSYEGKVIGRGIMLPARTTEGGRPAWRQAYEFRSAQGDLSTDTLFMDATTLRPIREARVSSAGRFAFRFDPMGVESTTLSGAAGPSTTRIPLDRPVFASAAIEAVVRSLPLGPDMRAQLDVYYPRPSQRSLVSVDVRVVRSEGVPTKGGASRNAWVVTAGTPGGPTTFWIDKETRGVLQFDTLEGTALIQFRR